MKVYAYCKDCVWDRAGLNRVQAQAQATAHMDETGHEVRGVWIGEIDFRDELAEAFGDA